jgi:peroxiredoxin
VTVNKRLLFVSLAVAAAVVAVTAVVAANRNGSKDTAEGVTISNPGDLSPTIGTNAIVSGHRLPAIQLHTLDGATLSTTDLIGHPLVINVWYSTCAPCKRELPAFAAAQAKFGDTVRFVGVNPSALDERSEEQFARDRGVQYELLYDPDGTFTSELGIATAPQTLFVDQSGTIVDQTGELTTTKLDELITSKLL